MTSVILWILGLWFAVEFVVLGTLWVRWTNEEHRMAEWRRRNGMWRW
jgi:hypothetical protein